MSDYGIDALQRQLDFAEAAHQAGLERMSIAWLNVLRLQRECFDTSRRVRELRADIEQLKVAA